MCFRCPLLKGYTERCQYFAFYFCRWKYILIACWVVSLSLCSVFIFCNKLDPCVLCVMQREEGLLPASSLLLPLPSPSSSSYCSYCSSNVWFPSQRVTPAVLGPTTLSGGSLSVWFFNNTLLTFFLFRPGLEFMNILHIREELLNIWQFNCQTFSIQPEKFGRAFSWRSSRSLRFAGDTGGRNEPELSLNCDSYDFYTDFLWL